MNSRIRSIVNENVRHFTEMVEFDRFVASETYTFLIQSRRTILGGNLPLAWNANEKIVFELPRRIKRC